MNQTTFKVDDQDSLIQALLDPNNPNQVQLGKLVDFNN
jgi:hypothetical protein